MRAAVGSFLASVLTSRSYAISSVIYGPHGGVSRAGRRPDPFLLRRRRSLAAIWLRRLTPFAARYTGELVPISFLRRRIRLPPNARLADYALRDARASQGAMACNGRMTQSRRRPCVQALSPASPRRWVPVNSRKPAPLYQSGQQWAAQRCRYAPPTSGRGPRLTAEGAPARRSAIVSAACSISSEWCWGVDRLHHLERLAAGLGNQARRCTAFQREIASRSLSRRQGARRSILSSRSARPIPTSR